MSLPVRQPDADAVRDPRSPAPPAGHLGRPDGTTGILVVAPPTLLGGVGPGAALLNRASRRRRRRVRAQVASYVFTVFVLITFNFALPRLMPGGPLDALMVQGQPNYVQNDRTRARLEEYYNLDGPILEQYGRYLKGLAQGDVGVSVVSSRPVAPELLDALPWTLLLIGAATLFSIVIGLPTGIHSGWKRGKGLDRGLLTFFMLWQNVPIFVVGSLAFVIFSVKLGLFPPGGGITPLSDYTGAAWFVDVARHLALPAFTMSSVAAAENYLLMRSAMVSELGSDYIRVGQAKGLRDRRLKYRYVGRNALLPVVTSIGLQVGLGVMAVIFIERIFAYPGIGRYMFDSIGTRDYPALQGAFLVLTLGVVTVNLLVDLLYRRIDPRTAT